MTSESALWAPLHTLLVDAVAAGTVPGAAVVVRGLDTVHFAAHAGQAELRPVPRAVRPDTPWDLASLTKALCTAPLCVALSAAGQLDLDAPLSEILDDAPPGVTARHCLDHSSGLPSWRPLFRTVVDEGLSWGTAETRARVFRTARTTPVEAAPGARHAYSDLGMLTLGAALEARLGARIDQLHAQWVGRHSGADLRWGWPGAAATEDCPVRRSVVVGQVHDLNAAVLGGRAPHAGLFGSGEAVAAAAAWQLRCWHGSAEGLDPVALRRAWARPGPGPHRCGWDTPTPGATSAGSRWPADGVGHLGFTGCTLWMAPRQGIAVVLLTNRVHPTIVGGARPGGGDPARLTRYRALRPAVFGAAVACLERAGLWTD